jgi:thiol-disulfide isomerase/thioredoxin
MKKQTLRCFLKIIACFLFLCLHLFAYSQSSGSIVSKNHQPSIGGTNIYYYTPPAHLLLPDKIFASVVYTMGGKNFIQNIPIKRNNERFQFTISDLDSAHALVMGVTDGNRHVLDNNNGAGYIAFLYNKQGSIAPASYLEARDLLDWYASNTLLLDRAKVIPQMISFSETCYRISPGLMKDSYGYYLSLLYELKKEEVKPRLLAYAKELAAAENDEDKWLKAMYIFRDLGMVEERSAIENKGMSVYPNGKIAGNKYLGDLYDSPDSTEQNVLDKMAYYTKRFGDTSERMKYNFSYHMITVLVTMKKYDRLSSYERMASNSLGITKIYDFIANSLMNESVGENDDALINAKMLSLKSLNLTAIQIANRLPNQNDGMLERTCNKYLDTYAQILYRLKAYDSAFYYQSIVCDGNSDMSSEVLERYALYAEKAKGVEFAYRFIMDQLSTKTVTPSMLLQLKDICKNKGITDAVYDSARNVAAKIFREKSAAQIKKKFGTTKAEMFTLKNLDGQTVSMSQFKNKIIVLDFWATWCVPCKASFPKLQETINKYKNDTDVVFLTINTWENARPEEKSENVEDFIKKNHYTFNVLLDKNNQVVEQYKIKSVPTKVIIDKKSDIVYFGDTDDVGFEIENARN